jgi:hypothetical protein
MLSTAAGIAFADFTGLGPLLATVDQRGHGTAQPAVPTVLVVVDLEVPQELAQVVEVADGGDTPQPLLLQSTDGSLRDGNGAVPADRPEPLLHPAPAQPLREGRAGEHIPLIGDDVLG